MVVLAKKHYTDALELAKEETFSCHPYCLGLATNHSLLLYDILGECELGLEVAHSSFNEAVSELDHSCCHDEGREVMLQLSVLYGTSCVRWRRQMGQG